MLRTQICFKELLLKERKIQNNTLENRFEKETKLHDFNQFVGVWDARDTTQESLRKQAWKIGISNTSH